MDFERNRQACIITKNQRSYINEVLKRFKMKECKPVGTSFNVNIKLLKLSNEEFTNVQREMKGVSYKSGVGSLMYAMVAIRADIAFAVATVNQLMTKASPRHLMAVKCIMRYLKGTMDF